MSEAKHIQLRSLVRAARSTRRFTRQPLSLHVLNEIIECAALSPCGKNRQWLRFALAHTPSTCAKIFDTLGWAAALPDWHGPEPNERPTAYIIIAEDPAEQGPGHPLDAGIAAQTIMLAARAEGIAACMIASIDRPKLLQSITLPTAWRIPLIIALGYPAEQVQIRPMPPDQNYNYWREGNTHCVPKLSLHNILLTLD